MKNKKLTDIISNYISNPNITVREEFHYSVLFHGWLLDVANQDCQIKAILFTGSPTPVYDYDNVAMELTGGDYIKGWLVADGSMTIADDISKNCIVRHPDDDIWGDDYVLALIDRTMLN